MPACKAESTPVVEMVATTGLDPCQLTLLAATARLVPSLSSASASNCTV